MLPRSVGTARGAGSVSPAGAPTQRASDGATRVEDHPERTPKRPSKPTNLYTPPVGRAVSVYCMYCTVCHWTP